jgi:hypothetical protein
VRDQVLEQAADEADAIAVSPTAMAQFAEHCRRFTLARTAEDISSRRLRVALTRRAPPKAEKKGRHPAAFDSS